MTTKNNCEKNYEAQKMYTYYLKPNPTLSYKSIGMFTYLFVWSKN